MQLTMDLPFTSLLVLLAYASGACCRTTRHSGRSGPRHHATQARSDDPAQRPVRSISEFLEPPPPPSSYRQHRGSAAYPEVPSSFRQWTLDDRKLTAAAVRSIARPARLGRLIDWMSPPLGLDSPSASTFPRYAAHMPQGAPSCEPCDRVPWAPLIRQTQSAESRPGEYAANFVSDQYSSWPALAAQRAPREPPCERPQAQPQAHATYTIQVQQSPIIDVEQQLPSHIEEPWSNLQAGEDSPSEPQAEVLGQNDALASASVDQPSAAGEWHTSVHFQRSPLLDLSVAGESEPSSRPESPVDAAPDDRQQHTEKEQQQQQKGLGALGSVDADDSSASRELAVDPGRPDAAQQKKIIQIIIPYTSQHTPSPFHPTESLGGGAKRPDDHSPEQEPRSTPRAGPQSASALEDSALAEESRRVAVSRAPGPDSARNRNRTVGNAIDVHRLQKNIDNWTIQEYAKNAAPLRNSLNATYPRWLSSKQIPDEYLLPATEEDGNEYYDFSHEAQSPQRGTDRSPVTSTTEAAAGTTTTTMITTTPTSGVKVVEAIHPASAKEPSEWGAKPTSASGRSGEKVYVVTPIPKPNSLEVSSADEDFEARLEARRPKAKEASESGKGLEQAYQVLPQAVNNLAALANAPESAAPALWGIMEHEQLASSAKQPRWRSESDVLPDPASTPILYAGHSKGH